MKPLTEFIVEVQKSHNDTITLTEGVELKIDVKFNQGEHVNLIGKIVEVPSKFETKIKVGDTVLVDRNMITFQVHSDHLVNKSQFLVDEKKGYYRVEPSMIYLYKSDTDTDWNCPAPYVFVEPIPMESMSKSGLSYQFKGYKGNKEQHGKCVYLNDIAKEQLKIGDTIYFKKDREYEFKIDGRVLYHMENEDLLAIVE